MPQMAPINWLLLFLMFSFILILFNIMNYYITIPNYPETSSKSFKSKPLNWQW
uniref:ATP synthase complex subunit 8 n=1 Tax=Protohermes spectabilis TaxID=2900198 RepID=A0A8K1T7Q7_9NEOP|nr:ATP synthase F0 subunit 8 [Protohermes spectabilis]